MTICVHAMRWSRGDRMTISAHRQGCRCLTGPAVEILSESLRALLSLRLRDAAAGQAAYARLLQAIRAAEVAA